MGDFVIFCQPLQGNWYAYAYINHYMSFFNGEECIYVSGQLHEIGHNLGLAHSGEGDDKYADETGLMGYSYYDDNGPKMCYNPAKNYQLGWYDDQSAVLDPTTAPKTHHKYTLNGVADYQENPDEAIIALRLLLDDDADYYVGYNRAVGANEETQMNENKVTIVQKETGGVDGYGTSWLVASLSSNESWTITNWNNQGFDVTVTVDGIIGQSVRDAKIVVITGDDDNEEEETPVLPKCKNQKGKTEYLKNGKKKKGNCNQIIKRGHCWKKDLNGKWLFDSWCPVKCKGRYNKEKLTTCKL